MPVIFLGAKAYEYFESPFAIAASIALALSIAGAVVGAVHGRMLLQLASGENAD